MILVFDLDDTLYPEKTFVLGGLKAAATYLAKELKQDEGEVFQWLKIRFENFGRDLLFDQVLNHFKGYTKKRVAGCLSAYRSHPPHISLYEEAKACLEMYQNVPKYVVTDGNYLVQERKCRALGLNAYMKRCLATHRFGLKASKPSPYCFFKISSWEHCAPSNVVYIADNPYKDFVDLKTQGFQTIRVLTGRYEKIRLESRFEADQTIQTLKNLKSVLEHLEKNVISNP